MFSQVFSQIIIFHSIYLDLKLSNAKESQAAESSKKRKRYVKMVYM